MSKPEFRAPTQADIVQVLRAHPLVKLREPVQAAYLVGSFAKGTQNDESDVDILLEVGHRDDTSARDLEDRYRTLLRNHFVQNDIRGKCDEVHPQWCGRRVDVYMTYDASTEQRPKLRLDPGAALVRKRRPP